MRLPCSGGVLRSIHPETDAAVLSLGGREKTKFMFWNRVLLYNQRVCNELNFYIIYIKIFSLSTGLLLG